MGSMELLTKMLSNCTVRECLWLNSGLVPRNSSSNKGVIESALWNTSRFVERETELTEMSVLCVRLRIL